MENNKKSTAGFILILVIMVGLMVFAIFRLSSYVKNSIHDERTNYLTSQTEAVAGMINSSLGQYLEYAEVCKQNVSYELNEGEDIFKFMDRIQPSLRIENARLILVDENCTWYGENGTTGRITDIDSYRSDTSDSLVYLTTGVDTNIESFVFRVRLNKPITAKNNSEEIEIKYCSVIYYLDDFSEIIAGAFPYNCNSFIIDQTGIMLYKNFRMGILIDGINLYAKYKNAEFLYGDEGEDLVQQIDNRQSCVAEMVIDGENYFICSAPLAYNDWTASFVVDSEELVSGHYINTIFRYIVVIASIFAVAVILAGFAVLRISAGRSMLEKQAQANEYLQKASVAKSEFLSNMSHDIRTPINGIMGMTAVAKKQKNNTKTQECLDKIDISAQYLLSLVNDVLDMSTIESGALKITANPLNLTEFAKECLDIINGQMQNRMLKISTKFDIKHPNVIADKTHLRQIIINILGNAVKFTPDGGEICFEISEIQGTPEKVQYLFKISDTGPGMEADIIENLWTRFAQGNAGARSNYKGTGLGMAITKKLVDAMDGIIDVASTPGKGSTFSILITLEINQSAAQEEIKTKATDINGAKILLAEDNDINIEIATELLMQCGAEITQAKDGKIAVELFEKSPEFYFNAILMDIMMPNMDGIEACKAIRAMHRADASTVPIIAMTANAMADDMTKSKTAGMNAHLNKPMNLAEVINTVSMFYNKQGDGQ